MDEARETIGALVSYGAGCVAGVVITIAFVLGLAHRLPVPPHSHEEEGE
jgi:hypothetical protein